MDAITVSRSNASVARLIAATYPDYRGRKVRIVPQSYKLDMRSYWSGGSRSYFKLINLATLAQGEMPQQSAFDKPVAGADSVMLPDGIACIERVFFCGKDLGLRIHVNPANLVKFLPQGR